MPASTTGMLPNVERMVAVLTGGDETKTQNAAGVLAYLAISSAECRKAISRVDGIAEALAQLIASHNVDLQHNAALLLGQLSTGAEFRRVFVKQPNALSILIARLLSEDPDIQCNVAWALRQLVTDGVHRDAMIRARTSSSLRPLLSSDDERVKTNALALIEVLRRPPKIQTVVEQGALIGLASLSSAGSGSDSERTEEASSRKSPKQKQTRKANSTPKGSASKRAKWETPMIDTGKKAQVPAEESPRVESAEEGIAALLSVGRGSLFG